MTIHPGASERVNSDAITELRMLIDEGELLFHEQEEKVDHLRRDLAGAEGVLAGIGAAIEAGREDLSTLLAANDAPSRMRSRLDELTDALRREADGQAGGQKEAGPQPDAPPSGPAEPVRITGKRSITLLRILDQDRERRWTATEVAELYFTGERPDRAVHQVRSGLEFLRQHKRVLEKEKGGNEPTPRAFYWICAEWVAVED